MLRNKTFVKVAGLGILYNNIISNLLQLKLVHLAIGDDS